MLVESFKVAPTVPRPLTHEERLRIETKAVIEQAIELVEQGWVKRKFESRGRYCAVGAIERAAMNLGLYRSYEAKQALGKVIFGQDRDDNSIWSWNDALVRRKKTVLRMMREAAASLE